MFTIYVDLYTVQVREDMFTAVPKIQINVKRKNTKLIKITEVYTIKKNGK